MVVLLDLDEDDFENPHDLTGHRLRQAESRGRIVVADDEPRPDPNLNGFSAALGCYPYVNL